LVVNLADGTVSGFGVVAHIKRTDDTSISFNGEGPMDGQRVETVTGNLDRITGALSVLKETTSAPSIKGRTNGIDWEYKGEPAEKINYKLVCKVTNRLF